MIFTNEEVQVLSTIIVALETGGQVYGNGDWGAFGEAYSLSSLEHAITIGTGWYGPNALKLLKKIYNADPEAFKKLDTAGVRYDFNEDWNTYKISDVSYMFNRCYSLISLPDLSKWNNFKISYRFFYESFNILNDFSSKFKK